MGTVKELLTIAEAEIGNFESPPYSNNIIYNSWFYGRVVMGSGYPWCMTFCQWVYKQATVALPSTTTASCTAMMEAAKKKGMFVEKAFMPGDLILFNFEGKKNISTHCGILKEVDGSRLYTIEGNTSLADDINGGRVMLRERKVSSVVGAVRPVFAREEDLDMTKAEFIKSLTDEEAYLLLMKAMAHADKLKQPDWSKKEGHWNNALKKKVVNTDTPEGILRRDEFIAVLGRMGLI